MKLSFPYEYRIYRHRQAHEAQNIPKLYFQIGSVQYLHRGTHYYTYTSSYDNAKMNTLHPMTQ